jgi:hypothetical protein
LPDLSAHEAVRQAIYTYCRGVDRLDPELIAAAFWPDATITLGSIYAGPPPGFVDVAMGFMGMFAATRHDVGNISLRRDGDAIGYEAYVRTWHWIEAAGKELVVLGRYIGRATARDGEWRIAEHGELMDWGEERAVDAGWFAANAELEKGRRDRGDASYRWLGSQGN